MKAPDTRTSAAAKFGVIACRRILSQFIIWTVIVAAASSVAQQNQIGKGLASTPPMGWARDSRVIGRLIHTGHAANVLAEGIEDARVPEGSMSGVGPTSAVPPNERGSGCGTSRALTKTQQQVVIGNVEEEIAGGLKLALEAAFQQTDPGVVEQLQPAWSIGCMEWIAACITNSAASSSCEFRKVTPVELSRHSMPPAATYVSLSPAIFHHAARKFQYDSL
jgi:hypothetical protein